MRAAGDFDFDRVHEIAAPVAGGFDIGAEMDEYEKYGRGGNARINDTAMTTKKVPVDISSYKPKVENRVWYISETDLDWISIGCYILGTGGGGNPYSHMLRMREILRAGGIIRVISPHDLKDDDLVGCGGGAGSPTVGIEKLEGDA